MPRPTGLHGPHELTRETISAAVLGVGPGAYALGRYTNGLYYIDYVGRSDTDLARRLCEHADIGAYPHLKYGFLGSPLEAFQKECWLFHEYGEARLLDNKIHPQRPSGSQWKCPSCAIFG